MRKVLCMGCMERHREGEACACGYTPNSGWEAWQLKPGTELMAGRYVIGRALGTNSIGIAYLGYSTALRKKVAIVEYYPEGDAVRSSTNANVRTACTTQAAQERFEKGRARFVQEACRMAALPRLPGIAAVLEQFTENGTAYRVTEYQSGETLRQKLARSGGRLPPRKALDLFRPLLQSLALVHQKGILHRDITPDNILLTKEDGAKLINFGAARESGDSAGPSRGYAPQEQYAAHSRQGPYTDIYALCATLYHCMTGKTPPDAPERLRGAVPESLRQQGVRLPACAEEAILKGLATEPSARWQSVEALFEALYEAAPRLWHCSGRWVLLGRKAVSRGAFTAWATALVLMITLLLGGGGLVSYISSTYANAVKALNLGDREGAIEILSQLTALYAPARNEMSQIHYEQGLEYLKNDQYEPAVKELRLAGDYPADAKEKLIAAAMEWSDTYLPLRQYDKMIEILQPLDGEEAVKSYVEQLHYQWAELLLRNRQLEQAQQQYALSNGYGKSESMLAYGLHYEWSAQYFSEGQDALAYQELKAVSAYFEALPMDTVMDIYDPVFETILRASCKISDETPITKRMLKAVTDLLYEDEQAFATEEEYWQYHTSPDVPFDFRFAKDDYGYYKAQYFRPYELGLMTNLATFCVQQYPLESVTMFYGLNQLRYLHLGGIDCLGMEVMGDLPKLAEAWMELYGTYDMTPLFSNEALREFRFGSHTSFDHAAYQALAGRYMQQFTLIRPTAADISYLKDIQIHTLHLVLDSQMDFDLLNHLNVVGGICLDTAQWGDTDIRFDNMDFLRSMPELTEVELVHNLWFDDMSALLDLKNLNQLQLRGYQRGHTPLEQVEALHLPETVSVKVLYYSN